MANTNSSSVPVAGDIGMVEDFRIDVLFTINALSMNTSSNDAHAHLLIRGAANYSIGAVNHSPVNNTHPNNKHYPTGRLNNAHPTNAHNPSLAPIFSAQQLTKEHVPPIAAVGHSTKAQTHNLSVAVAAVGLFTNDQTNAVTEIGCSQPILETDVPKSSTK